MWCAQIVGVTIATAFLALAMMTVLTAYEASVEASKLAVAAKNEFSIRSSKRRNSSKSEDLGVDLNAVGGRLSESSVKRRSGSEQAESSSSLASKRPGTAVV
jgi:hypothetical protein